jgi:hypothetical protein
MKPLFLLCFLVHLYFILCSQEIMNGFGLMMIYRKFLNEPKPQNYPEFRNLQTYYAFRDYARKYYGRSPIDCVSLLKRYQGYRSFIVLFCRSVWKPRMISPADIAQEIEYSYVLELVSDKIREIFTDFCCYDESKFRVELETASILIKVVENICFEVKSRGINDENIKGFYGTIAIWKFLLKNISIDFNSRTIDFNSLFRTINEIIYIVKQDSSPYNPSTRLSKLYALLWAYIRYIIMNNCMGIFDLYYHRKPLILYLILESCGELNDYNIYDFYPNHLVIQIEELYEHGTLQLDLFIELLERFSPQNYCESLKAPCSISRFTDLTYYFSEYYCKSYPAKTWRITALAEIEKFILKKLRSCT